MTFLLLLPTLLTALIMAAHFLRDWTLQTAMGAHYEMLCDLFLLGCSFTLPFLLLIPTRAVLRAMQVLLTLAAIDLAFTGYVIMRQRLDDRNPDWIAPFIIMAATGAFALFAAGLYQTRRLQKRYPRENVPPPAA